MVQQPLAKLPPDILIVLDASGSMNNDISDTSCGNNGCGATSKWAQMIPAINMVVSQTETTVNWGLKFFADTGRDVRRRQHRRGRIAANNANAVSTAITGRTSANGGVTNGSRTPTRLAENAGAAYMRGLTDQNPRFILLATDGLPNCAPGNSDTAADDSAGAVMAVADAATMGIPDLRGRRRDRRHGHGGHDAQQHGERGRLSARRLADLLQREQHGGVRGRSADAGRRRGVLHVHRARTRRTATPIARTSA